MLLLTLMWSTIRKQENVIRELSTRESWLEREVERLRIDNEKLYRWLRYNGEKVIDEMTCELDALSAVRQTNTGFIPFASFTSSTACPDGVGRDGGRRRLYTGKGPQ